jgi:hypothetical protein
MQDNRGRQRGDNRRPKQNPAPPNSQCNRIIEHIAMPPFRLTGVDAGSAAPALEANGANMLCSQLQITQRAHKAATPLAARLERLVRMKETRRLVRKRFRGV